MLGRRRHFMAIEDGQQALQDHRQDPQAIDSRVSGAAGLGDAQNLMVQGL